MGETDLRLTCLNRALTLDRHCQSALLALAADACRRGDTSSAFVLVEEASRAGDLPDGVRQFHSKLLEQASRAKPLEGYLRLIGRIPPERAEQPLSILLVTNLFPPQEMGGYGRMMWEFAHGLVARGHRVHVLTSEATAFGHNPASDEEREMEVRVGRTLVLLGSWVDSYPVPVDDFHELRRRMEGNASLVRRALAATGAELVLAGNIELLGRPVLQPALEAAIPVLHALANAYPGFDPIELPTEAAYWVAACSEWNGRALKEAGYARARIDTLYPGARIDRFFRPVLPDTRRLRICYASLVLPYKGADTLVAALGLLHRAGVDFSAEIAGDAPDPAFLGALQEHVRAVGMESKVRFTGFLNRSALVGLFARSNTLVFPSKFGEPFGISQVEALASGLVVVSSGTGGAKEIIRDGLDGILFPAGNDADLAAKLARLISEPGLMARLQRQAQARATVFSVEHAVRKIESLAGQMRCARAA